MSFDLMFDSSTLTRLSGNPLGQKGISEFEKYEYIFLNNMFSDGACSSTSNSDFKSLFHAITSGKLSSSVSIIRDAPDFIAKRYARFFLV